MTSVPETTTARVEGRRLQRNLDDIAFLERKLDEAWPDPRRIRAELDALVGQEGLGERAAHQGGCFRTLSSRNRPLLSEHSTRSRS